MFKVRYIKVPQIRSPSMHFCTEENEMKWNNEYTRIVERLYEV